jgi:hypothetical protein
MSRGRLTLRRRGAPWPAPFGTTPVGAENGHCCVRPRRPIRRTESTQILVLTCSVDTWNTGFRHPFRALPEAGSASMALSLRLNPRSSSRGHFDCGITGSGRSSGSLWAPWPRRGRFRWTGWRADRCTKSSKPPSNSHRGQLLRVRSAFPWQSEVIHELTAKTELGVGGDDEPRPAICLIGRA